MPADNVRLDDPLRPRFHFLPPKNWMNDPNGLIQWQGRYHLFYQHNPHAAVWGDIHWGHAVSDDLVHWEHLPIALAPTSNSPDARGVWSGCIVDNNGVATAIYTGVTGEKHEKQVVCIATSTDDDLITWEKHAKNPVQMEIPAHLTNAGFRDPYVWWHEGQWKMIIGAGTLGGAEHVLLYASNDLYQWEYIDILFSSENQNDHVYECPNFFKLGNKWVLMVSVMEELHVDVFVGLFWQNHFIPETHTRIGKDGSFFAPLTFEDDDHRRIMIGWIREQRTIAQHQAAGWAGVMSTPVEMMLLDNNQLALTPVHEMLNSDLATSYRQFTDVSPENLADLQATLPSNRLKVVVSDDLSKVIFIDGSVVEYFNFPDYDVRRIYDHPADLTVLADLDILPQKRLGVWTMPNTLE
ncbi:MAG: glycoside hydrolase family 32 protein [Chloroflexota bacterium]